MLSHLPGYLFSAHSCECAAFFKREKSLHFWRLKKGWRQKKRPSGHMTIRIPFF